MILFEDEGSAAPSITMGEETEKAAEQTLMNAGKPHRGRGRRRR